jgi:putative (di)nucleoside polyphosphate hydrolase
MPEQRNEFFRAGVGAIVTDGRGMVLAFERADAAGAWQLPQGGLLSGEEPLSGVLRELQEETGLGAGEVELLARYPEPLVYELPEEKRTAKTGRGQVHFWFFFRYTGDGGKLHLPAPGEFRAWRWQSLADLVEEVVEFRRPVYRRLVQGFAGYLGEPGGGGAE